MHHAISVLEYVCCFIGKLASATHCDRSAALRQEEVASVVVGMLPALDATRWLLSVEVPAAPAPALLSLNPIIAATAARDGFMASVGQYLGRKPSECLDGVPAPVESCSRYARPSPGAAST